MIERSQFIAQLERASGAFPSLPVTSAMLRYFTESLKTSNPLWWPAIAKSWEKRNFVSWTEAWGLLLTCIHFEALSDEDNPLVPYFPSCGGSDEVDPSQALTKFLKSPPKTFFENLKKSERRVYLEFRAPLWISPAALFFQNRSLPFYLVEINSGAGLNLAADILTSQPKFNADLIAARIGLDPAPLELIQIDHRRWLTASIFPDQPELIQSLDRAIEIVAEREKKEAAFIQLAPCPVKNAAKFIEKNIPSEEDVGLLIFNMGTTARMVDESYTAFGKEVIDVLKNWGDRAIWVEVETVRGEQYSATLQLRVIRVVDGVPQQYVMASFDYSSLSHQFDLEASSQFLRVEKPPVK